MKVDKVLTRLSADRLSRAELRRVARALGDELPRERLDVLRTFRAALARTAAPAHADQGDVDEASYATGYLASLLDLTAEYEAGVDRSARHRQLQSAVTASQSHELLRMLGEGPMPAAAMARQLGRPADEVAEALRALSEAGLVRAHAAAAGPDRERPYRLTLAGRRMAASLETLVSDDMVRGIRIAVSLFRHLLTNAVSPVSAFHDIAGEVLGNPQQASLAVSAWAAEARQAGLIVEGAVADTVRTPHTQSDASPIETLPSDVLWNSAPSLLRQIEARAREQVPVYVRTSDAGWGAWASALVQTHGTEASRAIVDGDIVARSIEPPDQRFLLLYDHLPAIQADRDEPTMRAFMERADARFVVAGPGDEGDVPDEFIRLPIYMEDDPTEITATG